MVAEVMQMALLSLRYSSPVLASQAEVHVLLPERAEQFQQSSSPKPYRVLWLLHGLGDDSLGWLRYTTIDSLIRGTDIAVVLPQVGHGFYTDMAYGERWFSYVAEELPRYLSGVLPLSQERSCTYICGNSMGGYGAMKLALTYPERFSRAAALSGALDVQRFVETFQLDGFDPRPAFGNDLAISGTKNDLLALLDKDAAQKRDLPALNCICGTEDILLEESRTFVAHARSLGIGIAYEECPGEHLWTSWQEQLPRIFAWLAAESQ